MESSKKLLHRDCLLCDPDFLMIPIHIARRPEDVGSCDIARRRTWREESQVYRYDIRKRYAFFVAVSICWCPARVFAQAWSLCYVAS